MPLSRRIPKRGFTNIFRHEHCIVNLTRLAKIAKEEVTLKDFVEAGIIKKATDKIKILGKGEMASAKTIHAHAVSQSALKKIENAGGKVIVLGKE